MDADMQLIRKMYPKLRRTNPTAITHCGSRQTVFTCVCGSVHTAATDYRHAKHVQKWRAEHAGCAKEIADAIRRGELFDLYAQCCG